MSRLAVILACSTLALSARTADPLAAYVSVVNGAQGLTASCTVNVIGGGRQTETVELGKPNRFRIDSDSELIVGDGKTVVRYDKTRKSYSQKPETDAELQSLFSRSDLEPWRAFFQAGVYDKASPKDAGSKTIRGMTLNVVEASLGEDARVTFYLSPQDKLVRLAEIVKGGVTSVVSVTSVATGAVDGGKFAFVPPAGSHEVTEGEVLYDSKVEGQPIPDGVGQIQVKLSGLPLDLYTYRPSTYKKGLFMLVFHGIDRHPELNRDAAKNLAEKTGALILAPDFDEARFGDEGYQSGGVYKDKKLAPQDAWTFSRIPELIYLVRKLEAAPKMPVYLIGHSAGGQFVGRLASLLDVGAVRYVAANPSAYVFPNSVTHYGYGLGGLPARYSDDAAIRRYLAQPLTVFIGTADTGSADLDQSAGAMAEGSNRYERAKAFFAAGRAAAGQLGCEFNWRLVEVPGIGHTARGMYDSPQAMTALFGEKGKP